MNDFEAEDSVLTETDSPLAKFEYQTFGPFLIASNQDLSSIAIANDFWDEVEETHPGLRSAIGVYVFVKHATKKSFLVPWYVGKTEKGFEKRFRQHKKLFAKLLQRNGRTAVFLIARIRRNSPKFMGQRKTLPSNEILETMLIERCLHLNAKLYNASKVKFVKGLVVPGFINQASGKPNLAARQFRSVLKSAAPEEF
jgi:hypothetical protein